MEKKKDDELKSLLLVYAIFLVALVGVDLFYSAFHTMPGWVFAASIILHIGAGIFLVFSILKNADPNFDWTRKITVVFLAAAAILTAGYKAYDNENNQVIIDSHQEQAK